MIGEIPRIDFIAFRVHPSSATICAFVKVVKCYIKKFKEMIKCEKKLEREKVLTE